jgi:hypothetical protein
MNYKQTVLEKLDRIDELYPPERLARSKERWRRLWLGEKPLDRLPFTYSPVAVGYWDISPKEQRLVDYLDEFIARGFMDDDFVPGMFAGCHQGGMASMFGARTFEVDNDGVLDTNCEQLLGDMEDAAGLPPPAMRPESIPARWISEDRWYIEQTDGRLPLHVVDSFGPVEIAGKLWGYENLFVAARLAPELFHKVMRYATDAFMLFMDEQRAAAGDLLIETSLNAHDWVPTGATINLGMDSLVMLSADFFNEYCAPYLAEVADRYAPLTIHSCGWFRQLVRPICEAPFINGLHLGQMTLAELIEAGLDDRVVVIPAGISVETLPEAMSLIRARGLRANFTIAGLWCSPKPNEWTADQVAAMKSVHEERVLPLLSRS